MNTVLLISYVILWVVVIVQGLALFALYHHFGQMYVNSPEGRARQGPRIGAALRRTKLRDLSGVGLELPLADRPLLLIFASTTCGVCEQMRDDLATLAKGDRLLEPIIVCGGDHADVHAWAGDISTRAPVVPDPGNGIAAHFSVGLTPFVVAVSRDGVVRAKGIASDLSGMVALGEEALLANGQPAVADKSQLGMRREEVAK